MTARLPPRLLALSLVVVAGCGATRTTTSLSPTEAQTLRTCVDRWNAAHMRGWGPYPASVGLRRLDVTRLAAVGLRLGPRRCTVMVGFGRGTWTCVMGRFGAYDCPLRHEPDRIRMTNENARMNGRGVLTLNAPLAGTKQPARLAWQRYPRIDGFVEPWTSSGKLRPGVTFTSTYTGGGTCSFGSEMSYAKSAVRCLWRGLYQVDPCFGPPGRWNHRGGIVACPNGPGATTFGRFVIGPPSYRAIDFPDLVPWIGVGAIRLDEPRKEVAHDYDSIGHRFHVQSRGGILQGYYKLHGSRVYVTFQDGVVNEIAFTTRYYRNWDGFGIGSRIPLGPCHRAARTSCEHRWHGFIWNAWVREKPCSCWVKVGDGTRSLPVTAANFLKHWTFLDVRHGRVTRIFMSQRFVD